MKKKENAFKTFFKKIGKALSNFYSFLIYTIVYIIVRINMRTKVKGKENINSSDEARVFVVNHYELMGPVSMFLDFPLKFRPWIIDKMLDPKLVKDRMTITITQNYKYVPKWFKKFIINAVKAPMIYTLTKKARGISVSQNDLRKNIETFEISTETLNNNEAIVIFPEIFYVKEGVNNFQTGFEHLAKFYYKKTGKKISFYPIFISKINKEINIEKPIVYNPENENNFEKERIVNYLYGEMQKSYEINEVNSPKHIKIKQKELKKSEKTKVETTKSRKKKLD